MQDFQRIVPWPILSYSRDVRLSAYLSSSHAVFCVWKLVHASLVRELVHASVAQAWSPKNGDQIQASLAVKSGPQKWRPKVAQPLQNCIAPTICIGQEIRCLPYAGFFYFYLKCPE